MPSSRATVAIVEDDAAMRKSLQRLLQAHGFTSCAFASAESFLESRDRALADALVIDINLEGGMSGIELQGRLRSEGTVIPSVFITAYDDGAARQAAMTAGCLAYLCKPFEPEELIETLRRGILPAETA